MVAFVFVVKVFFGTIHLLFKISYRAIVHNRLGQNPLQSIFVDLTSCCVVVQR
jgi:hypothetical protein